MGKILIIKGADFSTVSIEKVKFVLDKYDINVVANNNEYGITTGTGNYTEGTTITITAVANSGYKFIGWDDGNTDDTRTITVSENKTYTAIFEVKEIITVYLRDITDKLPHTTISNGTQSSDKDVPIGLIYKNGGQDLYVCSVPVYKNDTITFFGSSKTKFSRCGVSPVPIEEIILGETYCIASGKSTLIDKPYVATQKCYVCLSCTTYDGGFTSI